MYLGVIADDFTGGTDIASFLAEAGFPVIQYLGVPGTEAPPRVEAAVISLKSRSNPAAEAVRDSLLALDWLRRNGCATVYFKYCSTFDSTPAGNIGPVTDALLDALGQDMTIMVPALPVNGRTVYRGYLFVDGVPLHESGMRHHPVNPMTDANLMRLIEAQGKGNAANVPWQTLARGPEVVRGELDDLRASGIRYAVMDVLDQADLRVIAQAALDLPLVTGGSGLAPELVKAIKARLKQTAAVAADEAGHEHVRATVAVSARTGPRPGPVLEALTRDGGAPHPATAGLARPGGDRAGFGLRPDGCPDRPVRGNPSAGQGRGPDLPSSTDHAGQGQDRAASAGSAGTGSDRPMRTSQSPDRGDAPPLQAADEILNAGKADRRRQTRSPLTAGPGARPADGHGHARGPGAPGPAAFFAEAAGRSVVLCGSASRMAQAQVAAYRQQAQSFMVDIRRCLEDQDGYARETARAVLDLSPFGLGPVISSTAPAEEVAAIHREFGRERSAQAVEGFFGRLAALLLDGGVTTFIVAGGETSGSVVKALGVKALAIGPSIAPGVPWVRDLDRPVYLALKSGNFGGEDFFVAAHEKLAACTR